MPKNAAIIHIVLSLACR